MSAKRSRSILLVRTSPLSRTRAILQAGPLRLPAAIGRSGTGIFKREGDGRTPIAAMPVLHAFRRAGRLPALRTSLACRYAGTRDGWCDEPRHPAYNRPVRLPCPASAETLRRPDRLYDFVVVLDWNVRQRVRNKGSAIFLHVAKPGFEPTAGCVALRPADMLRLSPLLRRKSRLRVIS